MTKTEATRRARALERHGYFRPEPMGQSGYRKCPDCREEVWGYWIGTLGRQGDVTRGLREAMVTHLMGECESSAAA